MSPSRQFLRFAADCESMTKLTRDRPTDLTRVVWQSGGSAVRSGLNAKASRQRKLNFEGGHRGPNSDKSDLDGDILSPSAKGLRTDASRRDGLCHCPPPHVTIIPSNHRRSAL